ncbi:MAG: CsoS2 family carboxysome shell protein [Thiotrichales bacterium]
MPEQNATSAAKARAAAEARRRAATKGRAKASNPGSSAPRPASQPAQPASPAATNLAGLSGRDLARARRAMLAVGGKNGNGSVAARAARAVAPPPVAVANREPASENVSSAPATAGAPTSEFEQQLDVLCEIVERDQGSGEADANSVRQFCRERRRAMSGQGKAALPAQPKPLFGRGRNGSVKAGSESGRDAARLHRADMARNGRGSAPPARPSGRVRSRSDAPPKVEVGTTLAGLAVTGTQVERTSRVTGNEPGSCRVVTGTEYIGAEQFEGFCETRPVPNAAKVGVSATSRGQWVTGTEVGRSAKVTGDETGSCRSISGTEYLGNERFEQFCETRGLVPRPEKVVLGATQRKGLTVSGSDEARTGRVTGFESGTARAITGSQYSDAGAARLTINGAQKVALTHTVAGRPVTGSEVGRSVKVTGDEAGSCRAVSGTEYLSNEQFVSVCGTVPAPSPAKVGVDATRGGERITGNLTDRTEKVTGNEPGTCQRVTGTQYGEPRLCGGGVDKVSEMHTLTGRRLTGTTVDHAPKMTGDEQGGCQPVTGTEYYGQEQFATFCPGTPAPAAAKVGISKSPRGLPVSGTMVGRSTHVTGNEYGSSLPISGSPYIGREQIAGGCNCGCGCGQSKDQADAAPAARAPETRSAISAAPAAARFRAPMGRTNAPSTPPPEEITRPQDFSIVSPARYADTIRERITGSVYGSAGRITGPVNLAAGLVSGTPEFRYRDDVALETAMSTQNPMLPMGAEAVTASRITGVGREAGTPITGDDWARSGRVTGTEGHSAQRRNITLRGDSRALMIGARANKDRERPEAADTKITGGSGNAAKGAAVTVSGGARG